nr:hypothetical protein [Tanacetum cinerariifolium]
QVIEEGGAEEVHVEADTAAQGDDTTAHGDDAQEPSIPSPTPSTPPPQPPQDLPSTSQEDELDEVQKVVDVVTTAKVAAASTRRRKGVVIRDPKEESTTSSIIPADTKSKDKGKGIMVEEPKPLKKKQQQKAKEDPTVQRYQVMKRKPQTEAQARKNMIMYLKNVVGFKLDYFKGMSYDDIRPIFEVKFNSNMDFLLKTKE